MVIWRAHSEGRVGPFIVAPVGRPTTNGLSFWEVDFDLKFDEGFSTDENAPEMGCVFIPRGV